MSMQKDHNEAILVSDSMIQRGGSFVCALGKALQHADPDNVERIKTAFPEYWDSYKILAIRFDETED